MNAALTKLTTAVAVISLAFVAACGGSGPAELEDTPEAQAYLYRTGVMEVAAYKARIVVGMHREQIPLDEEQFVQAAQDLAAVSGMVLEGFMPEGLVGPSRAEPAIWENWQDFEQKADAFQEAAEMLAQTAEDEGFEAARELVQSTVGTCSDCHSPYRASEEE